MLPLFVYRTQFDKYDRHLDRAWDKAWLVVQKRMGVMCSRTHGGARRTASTMKVRVLRVCVGTGPLESLDEYLIRDAVTGLDDRGGAMALWFAVEMMNSGL